jgi:hypothetical protein
MSPPLSTDPLTYRDEADVALERAAGTLRRLLAEAAGGLDPFPPFPGAFFSYGIEVEAAGAASADLGCVVLAPDGELYELRMGQELPVFDLELADPVALRKEDLKPLDLPPRDYLMYAYNALARVVELLLEQEADRRE